jgi:hypothetical protein
MVGIMEIMYWLSSLFAELGGSLKTSRKSLLERHVGPNGIGVVYEHLHRELITFVMLLGLLGTACESSPMRSNPGMYQIQSVTILHGQESRVSDADTYLFVAKRKGRTMHGEVWGVPLYPGGYVCVVMEMVCLPSWRNGEPTCNPVDDRFNVGEVNQISKD